MTTLLSALGVLGAWLLFAGPIYQANVDLNAESAAIDLVRSRVKSAVDIPRISHWWWLFPPMRIWLVTRRRHEVGRQAKAVLDADEVQLMVRYYQAARGWLLVGLGAWLLLIKEVLTVGESAGWSALGIGSFLTVLTFAGLATGSARRHA